MEGATDNMGILCDKGVDSRCPTNMEESQFVTLEVKCHSLIDTVRLMQRNLVTLIFSAKKIEVAVRNAARSLFSQGQTVVNIGRRMDLLDWRMERRKWRCRRHCASRAYVQPTASAIASPTPVPSSASSTLTRESSATLSQPSLNDLQSRSTTPTRTEIPSRTASPPSFSSVARYSSPSSSRADDDLKLESCVEFSCSGGTPPRPCTPVVPVVSLYTRRAVSCNGLVNSNLSLNPSHSNSRTCLRRTVSCVVTDRTKEGCASPSLSKSSGSSRSVTDKISSSCIPNEALFSRRCHPKNKEAFVRHFYNSSLGKRLIEAGKEGKLLEVVKLLEEGADANFSTDGMWTLLHRAAARCQVDFISVLLAGGASPNIKNCYGYTALHLAAYHDSTGESVSQLIQAGADVDVKNRMGRTPMHYAAENSNEEAIRELLAAGASVTVKDIEGKTPFDVADLDHIQKLISPSMFRKKRERSRSRRRNRDPLPFRF